VEWHQSGDAQVEVAGKTWSSGAENGALEKGEIFVCKVSQVTSAAGSSISKEKLQEGFVGQGFPIRKQVRSSKAKRSNMAVREALQAKDRKGLPGEGVRVAENQKLRQLQGQGQTKGGIQGMGC
jgi:hypothetical protein